MKVKAQVNASGMLSNLKRTFSGSSSFITELLQNARRANASVVHIQTTETVFSIKDDGDGISDFQSLLTVAGSGWNPESNENPFGMGFYAALFASSRMIVSSGTRTFSASTAAILSGSEIVVQTMPEHISGTVVSLKTDQDYAKEVKDSVIGFPIPVVLNGETLPRPHAPADSDVEIEGIGICSAKVLSAQSPSPLMMYYQHVFVGMSHMYSSGNRTQYKYYDYIHLNQAQFEAKMPDRNSLVNQDEAKDRVVAALVSAKEKWLLERLSRSNSQREFLAKYYRHITGWSLQSVFQEALDYWVYNTATVTVLPTPECSSDDCWECYNFLDEREEIKKQDAGGVLLDTGLTTGDDFTLITWAYEHGIKFFPETFRTTPENVESPEVDHIEVVNERKVKGDLDFADVILCKYVNVHFEDGSVAQLETSFFDGCGLYITDSIEKSQCYSLVAQCAAPEREVDYLDYYAYEDKIDALSDFIDLNAPGADEETYLASRLAVGDVPSMLYGKTCRVKFGSGNILKVEVLD